ncbi:MAG: glycosyltransferase family protein [Balneolaceae bacterium]
MKILYGVQGTGHGHISRARVVLPKLREFAEVDVLISGYNFHLDLDGQVAYKARGISLTYDSKGSIDFMETALKLNPIRLIQDVNSVPVGEYDFFVNDFEPVTAWAAQSAGIPCVGISHQASFLSQNVPRPAKKSLFAEKVMKHFAPFSTPVGSHYLRYDDFIEPPIIRKQIKDLNPSSGDHITVYLPAFDHETLCSVFNTIRQIQWHIFSPSCDKEYQKGNVVVKPIGKETFLRSFESCLGVVSSTGFETTSEAMFLGKKLLTIPIKNQYEQLCNAAALEELGGKIIYSLDGTFKSKAEDWLKNSIALHLPETSDEDDLIQKILKAGVREYQPV